MWDENVFTELHNPGVVYYHHSVTIPTPPNTKTTTTMVCSLGRGATELCDDHRKLPILFHEHQVSGLQDNTPYENIAG